MPTLATCAASQIQQALHPTSTAECGAVSACGTTSPHLAFTITPDHGPSGTVVSLRVTGCVDPHGDSHALSYNTTGIVGTLTGQTLTARYRVTDAAPPVGTFKAQCSATVSHRSFRVTGSH